MQKDIRKSKIFKYLEKIIFFGLLIIGIIIILSYNAKTYHDSQFVELAQSFTQGKLYFLPSATDLYDSARFEDHDYWPLGPMPAVVLIPYVLVSGGDAAQNQVQFVSVMLIFYLLYKIARKITGESSISLWLAFGYVFATAFIGIAVWPIAWEFGQVIANLFMILCLYEFVYKKRWWLIGLYLGFAFLSRAELIIAGLFFILTILYDTNDLRTKLINVFKLSVPVILCIFLYFIYNYLRFHNIFELGYSLQTMIDPTLKVQITYGIWSLKHFPANLYYLFLKGPEGNFILGTMVMQKPYISANIWGMSIFLTSPIFLWLINIPLRDKRIIFCLLSVFLILFVLLGYYGIGVIQYGYRYAIDFYPLLFYMLAISLKQKSTVLLKFVIIISFFFNLFLVLNFYGL